MSTAPITYRHDFRQVAEGFARYYFGKFDAGAQNQLTALYRPESLLTWENAQYQGAQIMTALQNVNTMNTATVLTRIDAQPSLNNGVIVSCNGYIAVKDKGNLPFDRFFYLLPISDKPGYFYILNDIFRLDR